MSPKVEASLKRSEEPKWSLVKFRILVTPLNSDFLEGLINKTMSYL